MTEQTEVNDANILPVETPVDAAPEAANTDVPAEETPADAPASDETPAAEEDKPAEDTAA